MTVPSGVAGPANEILPGLLHWTMADDRIGFRSDAWAVRGPDGLVLIDPLPLSEDAARSLSGVAAICLTAPSHQRAAWILRGRLRVPVVVPDGSTGLDAVPDRTYGRAAVLPGRLTGLDAPGPKGAHRVLSWIARDGRKVLFTGDLVLTDGSAPPSLLPDPHLADPAAARETARFLAALDPDLLALAHGGPWARDAARALRAAAA